MPLKQTIGFIGAGKMATALAKGIVRSSLVKPGKIVASDIFPAARKAFAKEIGAKVTPLNTEVFKKASVIILAVKPHQVEEVFTGIKDVVSRQHLIISIVAGLKTTASVFGKVFGPKPAFRFIRVMPNTPAVTGNGASGMYANHRVSKSQRAQAQKIMEAVGIAVWVDEESLINTVTAVSGSGPAYFFYLMDAMVKAAQEGGLNPETSRQLTLQTALGAAQLALVSDESPTELRRRVTSPGGTTQAAVEILDKNGCKEILIRAVHAARERSVELAKLLGEQ